jgi:hypothetical protein
MALMFLLIGFGDSRSPRRARPWVRVQAALDIFSTAPAARTASPTRAQHVLPVPKRVIAALQAAQLLPTD